MQDIEKLESVPEDVQVSEPKSADKSLESVDALGRAIGEPPPSFAQSEFETIIRKQRINAPHGLKFVPSPTCFPYPTSDYEPSAWGSISYTELTSEQLTKATHRLAQSELQTSQFRSGIGVLGSAFYAFPAVTMVASIFSPLSLLIACLLMTIYRPILRELASAIRLGGGNYVFLLQCSGRVLGSVGAAATLLDAVATSVISADTAGAYLKEELPTLPVHEWVIELCVLVGITLVAFVSLRESRCLTFTITIIHMMVMTALMIASGVAWAQTGMTVMRDNWELRPRGGTQVARSIFHGVCIGFISVTGFEYTPADIQSQNTRSYRPTLRNLLFVALFLNVPLMVFVYALLPSQTILSGVNVLSILAEVAVGRPMRIVVVIDCFLVLAAGVFAGIVTGCRLMEILARERVLPQTLLYPLPVTRTAFMPVMLFFVLSVVVYASSGVSLATVLANFCALLYGVSCLLLKFSRDRLPRDYKTSLWTVVLVIVATLVVIVGNVVQDPRTLGLFLACFSAILVCILLPNYQLKVARIALWLLDQAGLLQGHQLDRVFKRWVACIRSRNPVVVWIKEDYINHLVQAIIYIRKNEPTTRVMFAHAYTDVERIPSELKANIKILDEAFPSTTLDLIFIKGIFGPALVEATSQVLDVSRSQMFMWCPGSNHPQRLGDYQGVRAIDF